MFNANMAMECNGNVSFCTKNTSSNGPSNGPSSTAIRWAAILFLFTRVYLVRKILQSGNPTISMLQLSFHIRGRRELIASSFDMQ